MIWSAALATGTLLGAALVWLLLRRRPSDANPALASLDERLKEVISSRDYTRRLPLPADSDLATVVLTLNRLLEQFDARDNVLQRGNATLEERLTQGKLELEAEIELREEIEEQLRLAREEAGGASTAKAEFLANMSHEIRTPLIGVIGMADLLQDSELDELQSQYAETLVGSANHLLTLVNDILDYSRLAADGLKLEETDFDLHELCYETATLLTPTARDRGVDLVVDYAVDVPRRAIGDPARVRQQLINLVGNAVKFTEEGSVSVIVRLESQEPQCDHISIAVRDTGIGIPREKLEIIFEQFTQADASTTRQFGGTGLGLAITRSLTQLMGGRIEVESEVGVGTTFRLHIPFGRVAQPGENLRPTDDWSGVPALVAMKPGDPADHLCALLREFGLHPEPVGAAGDAGLAARLHRDDPSELPPLVFADAGDEPRRTIEILRGLAAQLGDESPWFVLMADLVQMGSDEQLQDLVGGSLLRKPVRRNDVARLLDLVACREERPAESGAPLRALLAEDNVVNQRIVAAMLQRCGFEVRPVANGREALEAVRAEHFDLVLMDSHMPEMDGLKAARAIRALAGEVGQIPIVGMLSNERASVSDNCLRAGMNELLSKPVTFAKLEALTRRHFPPVAI